MMDIDRIIRYEEGALSVDETLELFADGIRSGEVWQLQGHYGRAASCLINSHLITPEGNIDWGAVEASR